MSELGKYDREQRALHPKRNKKDSRSVRIEAELPEGTDPFAVWRIKTGTVEMEIPRLRFEDAGNGKVRVIRSVQRRDVPLAAWNGFLRLAAALTHQPKPKYEQFKKRIHLVRDLMTRPKGMLVLNFTDIRHVSNKAERQSFESTELVRRQNLSAYEMMVAFALKNVGGTSWEQVQSNAGTCVAEAIARIAEEAEDTPKVNLKTRKPRKKFTPSTLKEYRTWCVGILENVIKEWKRTSHGDIEPETQRTAKGVRVLAYVDKEAVSGRSRETPLFPKGSKKPAAE